MLTHQESGRPLPRFSADDYVDWCVMEAIILKATIAKNKQRADEQAAAERRRWQQQHGVKGVTASEPEGGW